MASASSGATCSDSFSRQLQQRVPPTQSCHSSPAYRLFLGSNEKRIPEISAVTHFLLRCSPPPPKGQEGRVCITTSGLHGLGYALAEEITHIVLIDVGIAHEFWKKAEEIIREEPEREEAFKKIFELCIMNQGRYFPDDITIVHDARPDTKQLFLQLSRQRIRNFFEQQGMEVPDLGVLTLQAAYTLTTALTQYEKNAIGMFASQENYTHIRTIFRKRQFVALKNDWSNPSEMQHIAAALKLQRLGTSVIYMSNIAEYIEEKQNLVPSLECFIQEITREQPPVIIVHTVARKTTEDPKTLTVALARTAAGLQRIIRKQLTLET